jgi:ureidoglycolate lyase
MAEEETDMIAEKLKLEPLTKDAFAPFGDVVESEDRDWYFINNKMVKRYHDLCQVDTGEQGGRTLVSICEAQPNTFPMKVQMVERHAMSSQAFIPVDDNPFVVVVAPPGADKVRKEDLRAFITNGRQGINYKRGTWHHVLLVPKRSMRFLVVDRGGPGDNCEEFWFDETDQLPLEI